MARGEGSSADALVEAAIARVLEAERAAHRAAGTAREQAAVRIRDAHAQALGIARRAERRIGRYRAAIEQRVDAERRGVEAQIGALAHSAGDDPQILRREADAVERLVAELTGGDHD